MQNQQIRGLELARCNLGATDLYDILQELPCQGDTLEFLDLSYNPGTLQFDVFHSTNWSTCASLRELRLCGMKLDSLSESSLLPADTLNGWPLEELYLDRTKLNQETAESLLE
jgi:hypothetical protein